MEKKKKELKREEQTKISIKISDKKIHFHNEM